MVTSRGHTLPTPAVQPPAWVGRSVTSVCLSVSLSVLQKENDLSYQYQTWYTIYSTVVARHALTQRSKGQRSRSHGYENRHGRTVASGACCYGRVLLLPAWVCMSIRLPLFSSYNNCAATAHSNRRRVCLNQWSLMSDQSTVIHATSSRFAQRSTYNRRDRDIARVAINQNEFFSPNDCHYE